MRFKVSNCTRRSTSQESAYTLLEGIKIASRILGIPLRQSIINGATVCPALIEVTRSM